MEELEKKLKELKELLEKGMNNAGLGGPGSVKAGKVLPSTSNLSKPGNNSLAGQVKIPNVAPATKKNPVKSAEQTQNKDIKDLKMKEAHAQLVVKPMIKEELSFSEGGQWSLDKSGYKGYTPEDNARRKSNNIGETTGIHTMDSIKSYGGSGPSAAEREAKEMRAKSKKNPVKIYSAEEIAEMNVNMKKDENHPFYDYKEDKGVAAHLRDAKMHVENKDIEHARQSLKWAQEAATKIPKKADNDKTKTMITTTEKTEGRTTAVPGVSEMGIEVRRSNPKDTSYSKVVSPEKHGETAKDIARTNIKQTKEIKPKLPK